MSLCALELKETLISLLFHRYLKAFGSQIDNYAKDGGLGKV